MRLLFVCCSLGALVACGGGGGKKVLVMASGKITLDQEKKNISFESGTQHNEEVIELSGSEKDQINVKGSDMSKTFDLDGSGSFVINLKPDTLVGGVVRYGEAQMSSRIGLEQLDHMIDSTRQLMEGKNASDASQTYFIPPYTSKKISDNAAATLIGPYNNIPGSVKVDKEGKGPETYKFFTNKQKRESLDELVRQMKE